MADEMFVALKAKDIQYDNIHRLQLNNLRF